MIGSPSGKAYSANGVCQCKAYEFHNACWHRAVAKLVKNYDALATQQADRAARLITAQRAAAALNECFA